MCNKAPTRGWAQGFCGPHAQAQGLRNPRKNHDANSLRHGRERLRQQGMAARVAMGSDCEPETMVESDAEFQSWSDEPYRTLQNCKETQHTLERLEELGKIAKSTLQVGKMRRAHLGNCEEHTWQNCEEPTQRKISMG
jgi:hypothetical protein